MDYIFRINSGIESFSHS